MIEVELKFKTESNQIAKLTKSLELINKRQFTDTYYDSNGFRLTKQDLWLRQRDNKFELKVPMQKLAAGARKSDQYDELTNEEKIRRKISLPKNGDLRADLKTAGYLPFCTLRTTRTKYRQGEFIIDLDHVDYGDFDYDLGEVELTLNDVTKIPEATKKIRAFAKLNSLSLIPVRGKVVEYLKNRRPNHYQALLKSGVILDL